MKTKLLFEDYRGNLYDDKEDAELADQSFFLDQVNDYSFKIFNKNFDQIPKEHLITHFEKVQYIYIENCYNLSLINDIFHILYDYPGNYFSSTGLYYKDSGCRWNSTLVVRKAMKIFEKIIKLEDELLGE